MQIQVTAEYEGARLDAFVSTVSDPPLSRNAVQLLCEQGLVLCNGIKAGKSLRVLAGDQVEYSRPDPVKLDAFPENIPIDIVYEDEHLLVIDKPQGMVVHPAAGHLSGTLVNAVLYHCAGRLSSINGIIRPGIVHRIDKDTSGLLVMAKNNITHVGLSTQFAQHSIDRFYFAVVHGRVKTDQGRIDKPIGRHPIDRKKMCVTEKNARNAATNYEVLERFSQFSLVRCKLETGRTHQIRVHMAAIGHPVAGDAVYGPAKRISLPGQCLHAAVLGFSHPITDQHLIFDAPLPQYFSDFIEKLRRSAN